MALLEVGMQAPNFKTIDQNGEPVTLEQFRGKKVILYFYPKDDTPGCTKEACGFRDNFEKFKKINVEVLGVSVDDEKKAQKICGKI